MDYHEDYKLDVFDTYSFLIIAPVSALVSLMLFLAHCISKELRKQPGDLILMISFTEFVLSCHYFMIAYRTSYISTGIQESSDFCRVNSMIAVTAQVMEFIYSICFLVHIFFTMNSSIQKGFIPKNTYHVATFFIAFGALFFNLYQNRFGKDPYGICSMKVGKVIDHRLIDVLNDLFVATLALLVGVFLATFVLIYTQKKLPNFGDRADINHLRRDFLNYYKTYIKSCIFIWLIIFVAFLAQIFGQDQQNRVREEQDWKGLIFNAGRIGNTAKVLMPLIFFFVRIQDPLIRKRIWKPFVSLAQASKKLKDTSEDYKNADGLANSEGDESFPSEEDPNYSIVQQEQKTLKHPRRPGGIKNQSQLLIDRQQKHLAVSIMEPSPDISGTIQEDGSLVKDKSPADGSNSQIQNSSNLHASQWAMKSGATGDNSGPNNQTDSDSSIPPTPGIKKSPAVKTQMDRETLENMQDVAEDDQMWMNLLPAKIKETYTRTFLACISCKYQSKLESMSAENASNSEKSVWEYEIRGDKLMTVLRSNKSIVDCIFAIYSPQMFIEVIRSTTYKELNIGKSLDIKLNEEKIKKAGESKGGASGELFMFSHDNQFILKTTTADEIKVFKSLMVDYKDHMRNFPRTQIGKIFGLFEFTFRESDKSIKLILIENLFTIPRDYILRKYDLKGSSYSRRVLKQKGEKDFDMTRPYEDKILKDLDFKEFERSIQIDETRKRELFVSIEEDIKFFSSQGIMDYSLILAVVSIY